MLTCICGHVACTLIHGYYTRFLKAPEGKRSFCICRVVICSCCNHIFVFLPSFMIPYSQISIDEQFDVFCPRSKRGLGKLLNRNPSIDESNYRYYPLLFPSLEVALPFRKITLSDKAPVA